MTVCACLCHLDRPEHFRYEPTQPVPKLAYQSVRLHQLDEIGSASLESQSLDQQDTVLHVRPTLVVRFVAGPSALKIAKRRFEVTLAPARTR